jgi:(p)ppGpp synthase/HD superfamily hydrolase
MSASSFSPSGHFFVDKRRRPPLAENGRGTTEAARATVWSFGDEVGRIVEHCTDADTHPKPLWLQRKKDYLARLATEDRSVLLVSASDKLHNARSIVRGRRPRGERERRCHRFFSATQISSLAQLRAQSTEAVW